MTIIAVIIMILFVIPVFTGFIVNIGNVTGFLCGFFLYCISRDHALLSRLYIKVIAGVLCICVIIALFLTFRMVQACYDRPEGNETLIILGCEIEGEKPTLMMTERLRAGLEYLEQYPETSVVCSGGKGKGENISEALAMKRWLLEHGVEESRIYLEDASETTGENIRFSRQVMEDSSLNMNAAVCTNNFHIYRSLRIASREGLACRAVSAPTALWLLPTFYVRELYAILYYDLRGV